MLEENYHKRVKAEKRNATLRAGLDLFLEKGYERTSLQQIAKLADVSTATLFKRFPSKAHLFAAIVQECWHVEVGRSTTPAEGNPKRGLRRIGLDYAQCMRAPEMKNMYRLIISEAARFPDLGQTLYDAGKAPFLARLDAYLASEVKAGTVIPSVSRASRQFLATIAGQIFWPELLVPGCGGSDHEVKATVEDAVSMMLARYGIHANGVTIQS